MQYTLNLFLLRLIKRALNSAYLTHCVKVTLMSEASQAVQKIARGTGIVFAGTVISMFFGFLSKALIVRHFSTAEDGCLTSP